MDKITKILILTFLLIAIDLYAYQAIRTLIQNSSDLTKRLTSSIYWGITIISVGAVILYNYGIPKLVPNSFRSLIVTALVITYFSKLFGVAVLIIDDVVRAAQWVYFRVFPHSNVAQIPTKIERSEFLAKASLIVASVPLASMSFGIISGAHDYRIKRRTIKLPHLPASFDGMRIMQISDIHSGSFFNKKAVQGGVDMAIGEKPDIVFFTGDLVNNDSDEVNDYISVFSKISAPLGVYSILGNHDYGDYKYWPSAAAKLENLKQLFEAHKLLGWDLLRNENRTLKVSGESLAIIGVENWGAGRFSKYGDLEKAYQGIEDLPVKLLLSHDPSHWDAQIRPQFPEIDVTFSGHTHGFQFGVEIGDFRWSPSQYIYKQWADLYQTGNQYLYVNRGFGYLGYPGRIGILPEITMIELKRA